LIVNSELVFVPKAIVILIVFFYLWHK